LVGLGFYLFCFWFKSAGEISFTGRPAAQPALQTHTTILPSKANRKQLGEAGGRPGHHPQSQGFLEAIHKIMNDTFGERLNPITSTPRCHPSFEG
jgi:hypothetical protein